MSVRQGSPFCVLRSTPWGVRVKANSGGRVKGGGGVEGDEGGGGSDRGGRDLTELRERADGGGTVDGVDCLAGGEVESGLGEGVGVAEGDEKGRVGGEVVAGEATPALTERGRGKGEDEEEEEGGEWEEKRGEGGGMHGGGGGSMREERSARGGSGKEEQLIADLGGPMLRMHCGPWAGDEARAEVEGEEVSERGGGE